MALTHSDTYAVLDRAYFARSGQMYYLRILRAEEDAIAQVFASDANRDPTAIPLGGTVCCRPSVALALAQKVDTHTRLGSWDDSNAAAFSDLKGESPVTEAEVDQLVRALVEAVPADG